jgi:hypothetical protein
VLPIACNTVLPTASSGLKVHGQYKPEVSQSKIQKFETNQLMPLTAYCVTQYRNVVTDGELKAINLPLAMHDSKSEINQIVAYMNESGLYSKVSIENDASRGA